MRTHRFLFTVDADWIPGSEGGLEALLRLCDELSVRATIFTTGKFALAYGDLVRAAQAEGHEVGAHGWQHPMPTQKFENYRLTLPEQRREWLTLATEAITATTGIRPRSFRAPFLWVDAATFRLLAELGYLIDSSIPTRRFDGLVGVVNYREYFWAPLDPYYLDLDRPHRRGSSSILEVPPSAFLLPMNMSTMRFVGRTMMLALVRVLARRSSVLNFYCHPWEFVPAARLQYPSGSPPRHTRGTGPHLLPALRSFVEAVLSLGYGPMTISEVTV
jgi:peptidoglycan/xylan/chitin deacetylase (PgdA/CDA1 family)